MNMRENKGIFTCIMKKRLFSSSNLYMCEIHNSTWLLSFSLAKGDDTLFSFLKMGFYYRCMSMISGSGLFLHTPKSHICRACQPLLHPKKFPHGIIFISIDSFCITHTGKQCQISPLSFIIFTLRKVRTLQQYLTILSGVAEMLACG